jgi:putative aminopeptidase FrvX
MMNVLQKFLELTKETYPHGHEEELFDKLPNCLKQDEFGNLFYQIGDNPSTMFTCHLDTASHDKSEVTHVIKDGMIYTDGSTILGADDKAGVVVLLSLMENKNTGLYYFFLGEERGCVGSRKLASVHSKNPIEGIKKVVSFDRRGKGSVITHQLSGRCCSEEFAKELSKKLNQVSGEIYDTFFDYSPDSTGIYTDSAQFTGIYSECTNISVGYQNEHTKYESQDITHLIRLCEVVKKIDWDSIGSYRDQTKNNYYGDEDDDYGYGYQTRSYSSYKNDYYVVDKKYDSEKTTSTSVTILDTKYYGFESKITYDYNSYDILNVKLHPSRIAEEKLKIDKVLTELDLDWDELNWDGNTLVLGQDKNRKMTYTRSELTNLLPRMNDWIETEIKYNSIS